MMMVVCRSSPLEWEVELEDWSYIDMIAALIQSRPGKFRSWNPQQYNKCWDQPRISTRFF